jgi:hypothetical protein
MPDGSSFVDAEVPVGKNESLQITIDKYLDIPERINLQKTNNLGKEIALFLARKGKIENVKTWRGSWGFKWESKEKAIYRSERPMPPEMYDKYVILLGKDEKSGEPLWPQPSEIDKYRFLHEVGHAYQDYQIEKDGSGERWYDRAVKGEIDSYFGILFGYCYDLRTKNSGKGLSTWGSQSDYSNLDLMQRNAVGALEDVNELATMYLWHPKYFETHMKYLAQEIPGYGRESLDRDNLTPINSDIKDLLIEAVTGYMAEAKESIADLRPKP